MSACDQKLLHCVACIGLGFKSKLYFYDVYTNTNGKMNSATYKHIYSLLFAEIERHHGSRDFVLREDGGDSHTEHSVVD